MKTHFHMKMTRFEKEVQDSSEMTYYKAVRSVADLKL